MLRLASLVMALGGLLVSPSEAEAGILFHRRGRCDSPPPAAPCQAYCYTTSGVVVCQPVVGVPVTRTTIDVLEDILRQLSDPTAGQEGIRLSARAAALALAGSAAFPGGNAQAQRAAEDALKQQQALLLKMQELIDAVNSLKQPSNPGKGKP